MPLDIFHERGTPLDRQVFTWKDLVGEPISKLDDDAFTRIRVILMHGVEQEACRSQHMMHRMNGELRQTLARIRRVEHHQATLVNWLLRDNGDWDQNKVDMTFESLQRLDVECKARVPIHTTYITAWANRQGTVSFRDDVYEFDAQGKVSFEQA